MGDLVERIIASLTPSTLRKIILELAKTQPPEDPGVMVNRIVEALTQGKDLGAGPEGWQALLQLQQAIRDTVAQISGMQYVEADS